MRNPAQRSDTNGRLPIDFQNFFGYEISKTILFKSYSD